MVNGLNRFKSPEDLTWSSWAKATTASTHPGLVYRSERCRSVSLGTTEAILRCWSTRGISTLPPLLFSLRPGRFQPLSLAPSSTIHQDPPSLLTAFKLHCELSHKFICCTWYIFFGYQPKMFVKVTLTSYVSLVEHLIVNKTPIQAILVNELALHTRTHYISCTQSTLFSDHSRIMSRSRSDCDSLCLSVLGYSERHRARTTHSVCLECKFSKLHYVFLSHHGRYAHSHVIYPHNPVAHDVTKFLSKFTLFTYKRILLFVWSM